MNTQTLVSELQAPADYRTTRQHLFPSQGSLDWFIRRERGRLVKAGALRLIAGRWLVAPEAFDLMVLEVGQQDAQKADKPAGNGAAPSPGQR